MEGKGVSIDLHVKAAQLTIMGGGVLSGTHNNQWRYKHGGTMEVLDI